MRMQVKGVEGRYKTECKRGEKRTLLLQSGFQECKAEVGRDNGRRDKKKEVSKTKR